MSSAAVRLTHVFDRLVWAALVAGSVFVLSAARWLTPDASGVGTHLQLGLPPCGFLALFELPCPACGLTTSFAYLADLELGRSLEAHPVGLPLFMLTVLSLLASVRGLVTGDSVTAFLDQVRADRVALAIAGALLATWFVRLLF